MRRVLAALILGAGGCLAPADLPPPPLDGAARTLVVRVDDGRAPQLWVRDLERSPTLFDTPILVPEGTTFDAFAYSEPPEALQVVPGGPYPMNRGSRRLPPPLERRLGHIEAGRLAWAATPPERPEATFPDFDWPRCAEAGGCTDRRAVELGGPPVCQLDCAPPTPAPPAMPALPDGPGWAPLPEPDAFGRVVRAPVAPPRAACGPGEVQPHGAVTCAPLAPCADDWPAPPSDRRAVYVRAGADPGGDGSPAAPFSTLAAALTAAQPGDAILLSPGGYPAPPALGDVALFGACPARTSLVGAHVTLNGADVELAGIRLPPLALERGGLTLRDVEWASPRRPALTVAAGTTATVARAALTDTSTTAFVVRGDLTLDDVTVQSAWWMIAEALDGGVLRARRLAGRDVGAGLVATRARLDAEGVLLEGLAGEGVTARGAGATAAVRDVTLLSTPRLRSRGVSSLDGGIVEAERVRIDEVEYGLVASGGVLRVRDAVILSPTLRRHGAAANVVNGGHLVLERAFLKVQTACVLNREDAGAATIEDTTFDNRLATTDPRWCVRLYGGAAELRRVAFALGVNVGIALFPDRGIELVLEDARFDGGETALRVELGTRTTIRRLAAAGTRQGTIIAGGTGLSPARLSIEDLDISGARAGPALDLQGLSEVMVRRFSLDENTPVGVRVWPTADVDLEGGRIAGHPTGALYNPEDRFGLLRLMQDVVYDRNTIAIAVEPLP